MLRRNCAQLGWHDLVDGKLDEVWLEHGTLLDTRNKKKKKTHLNGTHMHSLNNQKARFCGCVIVHSTPPNFDRGLPQHRFALYKAQAPVSLSTVAMITPC